MAFPKTYSELRRAGYSFSSHGTCSGCQAPIEWWNTPTKSRIPMNPMPSGESEAVSHFATCPKAKDFKKSKQKTAAANRQCLRNLSD